MSDDEEETKRVVRSAREKRYEQLKNDIHKIRNSMKINDFKKMEEGFQDLCKDFDKTKPVIDKEENGVVPRFYFRILFDLERKIDETWASEQKKKLNKQNAKSLGTLRQRLRRYLKEKEFEADVEKIRQNPDEEVEEEEPAAEEQEDGGSDDEAAAPKAAADFKKKKTPVEDDDESDDSYWDSDSDESDSSSSDDQPGMSLREKFLKKTGDKDDADKKEKKAKEKAEKRKERKRIAEEDEDEDEDDDWIKVDGRGSDKPKMFEKDAEITHDLVVKKLHEIMAARGRKRTNRKEQIELLTELFAISEEHNLGVGMAVKIKFAIVSGIFDYNPKISAAMKPEYWEKCMPAVEELLEMVENNPDTLTTGEGIMEDSESVETAPYRVRGCFLSCVERLNEEFHKVLKSCDAHSNEYVDRLKDEPRVMEILLKAQNILEKTNNSSEMCRIYLQRIEHIYFKFDPNVIKAKNVSKHKIF